MEKKSGKKKSRKLPEIIFGIAGAQPGLGSTIFFLIIPLFCILAYSNTLHAPFQWDESPYIEKNPIVKNLAYFLEDSGAKGLKTYSAFRSRYIGYLTFALNYRLHGTDVTGYHIVNILIHLANSILVYFLVVLTLRTPFLSGSQLSGREKPIAFFSALIFACHPVQIEAVTYVFQRLASLMTMFYLLSLVCYIKHRTEGMGQRAERSRSMLYALCSLLFAVLAMKTKENAFTLPVVIALYEFSFFGDRLKKKILNLLPILLTLLIIPLSLAVTDRPFDEIATGLADASRGHASISRHDYLITQFRVIVTYIRLLFFPINQNFDYDYPVYNSLLAPEVFLSLLLHVSLIGLAIYLFRLSSHGRQDLRILSFGILWFYITLSVESSVIPIPMVINEYRVYLPSAGLIPAFVAGLFLLADKTENKNARLIMAMSVLLIPLTLAYATYTRNNVWGDSVSMWEDVVAKSPHKTRGHYNLAYFLYEKGNFDHSLDHFQVVLNVEPKAADVNNYIGNVYRSMGRLDKAKEHYQTALESNPGYADVYNNLGIAYALEGSIDKAMEHFSTALKIQPDYAEAHFNMGLACFKKGLYAEAKKEFEISVRINPDNRDAKNLLDGMPPAELQR